MKPDGETVVRMRIRSAADGEATRVQIRPEADGDRARVQHLVQAAFEAEASGEGSRVAALEQDLRTSACGRDDFSLVAQAAGKILGQVLLTRSWVDASRALVPVWVLSPVSVHPQVQRRGIGSALIRAALVRASRGDLPLIFLEGDPGYYSRLGFTRASTVGFTAPSERIPDPAFQVAVLPAHETWMRGALVYSDVFWTHDAVGLRAE